MEYGAVDFRVDNNNRKTPLAGGLIGRADSLRAASLPGNIVMLSHAATEFTQFDFPWDISDTISLDETKVLRQEDGWVLGKDHDAVRVSAIYGVDVRGISFK